MKKYYVIIAILFVMTVFVLPVSASATAKAGVKPGSFFYFLTRLLKERICFSLSALKIKPRKRWNTPRNG